MNDGRFNFGGGSLSSVAARLFNFISPQISNSGFRREIRDLLTKEGFFAQRQHKHEKKRLGE
jgi:hypothetical protein